MSDAPTTTARLLTPPGRGGIAVIALVGPAARRILDQCFRPRASHTRGHAVAAPGQLQLGEILDGNDVIDEAILTHTPRGAEINIHGGPAATRRVLQRLADLGAQLDTDAPTSLLNPAHPTWQNPAVGEELLTALPVAPSLFAATCLASQWSAGLSQLVAETLATLENMDALPVPQACELARELRQAAGRLTTMQKLLDPPEVVLAGPPNAGKSTLANALVARPVSIVHATAGTTRDWIRELAILEGRAVWLTDTAGLWDADHDIDNEAVRRAWDRIDTADLVLICTPADNKDSASNELLALRSASPNPQSEIPNPKSEIPNSKSPQPLHAPTLAVTTKADLAGDDSSIHNPEFKAHNLLCSAETGEGLADLRAAILSALGLADIDPATPAAFTPHQADLLTHAAEALDQGNVQTTLAAIRTLLGD